MKPGKEQLLNASMQVVRNSLKEAVANQRKSKDGTVPKESHLNRCLTQLERISNLIPPEVRNDSPILREAWDIYFDLQNFEPKVGESLHWRPGTREVHLEDMNQDDLEEMGSQAVFAKSAEVYSGGLGFKHVNWDSNYLMAQPKQRGHDNPYWRPDNAKKAGEGLAEMRKLWDGKPPRSNR